MLNQAPKRALFSYLREAVGRSINRATAISREGVYMPEEITALDTQDTAQAADAPGQGAESAENPSIGDSRTYTQEEFEAALEAAVKERTAGAVRERADRLNKQKRELSNANKTLEEQVATLAQELEQYKQKEQMHEIARKVSEETGVPAEVLRGTTEEELKAHAETLKAYFKKPSAPYVESDGFASGGKSGRSLEQIFGEMVDDLLG